MYDSCDEDDNKTERYPAKDADFFMYFYEKITDFLSKM